MPRESKAQRMRNQCAEINRNRRRAEEERQQLERRQNSERILSSIQDSAIQLKLNRETLELKETALENWEIRNPYLQKISAGAITGLAFSILLVVAVYIIDVTVLGDVARETAKTLARVFDGVTKETKQKITAIVAFILPAAYLVLEVFIGYRLEGNQDEGPRTSQTITGGYGLTLAFAVLVWLTLPALVFAFALANSSLLSKNLGNSSFWAAVAKVAALTLLALVAHGAVLWNGGRIWNAVSYFFVYKPYEIWLSRRINRLGQNIARDETRVEEQFRNFYQDFTENNAGGQNGVNAGLFSTRMRETVNVVFGNEIIANPPQTEGVNGSAPINEQVTGEETGQPPPEQAGNTDENNGQIPGDSIFDRDDEDEVLP